MAISHMTGTIHNQAQHLKGLCIWVQYCKSYISDLLLVLCAPYTGKHLAFELSIWGWSSHLDVVLAAQLCAGIGGEPSAAVAAHQSDAGSLASRVGPVCSAGTAAQEVMVDHRSVIVRHDGTWQAPCPQACNNILMLHNFCCNTRRD